MSRNRAWVSGVGSGAGFMAAEDAVAVAGDEVVDGVAEGTRD